jgi:hypothetical protein
MHKPECLKIYLYTTNNKYGRKVRVIRDIKQKLVSNPIPTTTSPLEKYVRIPRKK